MEKDSEKERKAGLRTTVNRFYDTKVAERRGRLQECEKKIKTLK